MDMSLRSPLKPGINPTFRGIVVQVRIFRLKRAKMPFSARKLLLETAFLPFSSIFNTLHPPPLRLVNRYRSVIAHKMT